MVPVVCAIDVWRGSAIQAVVEAVLGCGGDPISVTIGQPAKVSKAAGGRLKNELGRCRAGSRERDKNNSNQANHEARH